MDGLVSKDSYSRPSFMTIALATQFRACVAQHVSTPLKTLAKQCLKCESSRWSNFREGSFEALLSAPRYLMNKILYKRQKVMKNKLIIWQQIKVNVDISNLLCQNFLLLRTFLNTKMLTNFAVCLNKPICVDLKHPLFVYF